MNPLHCIFLTVNFYIEKEVLEIIVWVCIHGTILQTSAFFLYRMHLLHSVVTKCWAGRDNKKHNVSVRRYISK